MMAQAKFGPLSDIRVLEMGQLLAGPFCGQLLADFGAEVIKVEPPGSGDPMRQWGQEKPHGKSLWWPIISRGKKCITLNLRLAEGQEIAMKLAAQSDILVENFRPGTLERWNLDYDRLSEINPGLILIRVTGYGQSGPYSQRAGFGSIGEAMGGLRYVTGYPDRVPSRVGISIGDQLAATMGALGGLLAIHERHTSGKGQIVDVALYEAVLAYMESLIPEYQIADYIRERTGSLLPNIVPSNVYPTKDQIGVIMAANQDNVFGRLCQSMGQPELAEDPRFSTHGARGASQAGLDEIISEWTSDYDSSDLVELLNENGVPCSVMYRAPEMLADPQFAAREMIKSLPHPEFGEIQMHGIVPKLSRTPGKLRWVGPELGAHNDEIFGSLLGLGFDELAELESKGVI